MADWTKPTITSEYVTFVDEVRARDVDAITLQLNALVNPPTGSIRLLRTPTKFQEWNGTAFVDKVLAIEGGGTGSTNLSGMGSAMGLGSMAYQNSNAIAVTGGTIANVNSSGTFTHSSGAIVVNEPPSGDGLRVNGPNNATGHSLLVQGYVYGLVVQSGSSLTDASLIVRNRAMTVAGIVVSGDQVVRCAHRLVIPVGANKWA